MRRTVCPLLRLLAPLLAAVIVIQGLAAAQALALGALHLHPARESAPDRSDHGQHHHHGAAERHHHGTSEVLIDLGPGDEAFETAGPSLAAWLPAAPAAPRRSSLGHVMRAGQPWAWATAVLPLPDKRPRRSV